MRARVRSLHYLIVLNSARIRSYYATQEVTSDITQHMYTKRMMRIYARGPP